MTLARLILALLAVAVGSAFAAAPASAATGPCYPGGPKCHFWYAKVTGIKDGDTIDVDIAGDGTRALRRVRMTGYNAMELTHYSDRRKERRRGECHGVGAANRLHDLVRASRWRVRLAAQRPSSRGENGRLKRQVSVKVGKRWVDVGPTLLAEGRVLAFAASDEWAWNRSYSAYARQAAAARIGVWDPQGCGAGPAPHVTVGLRVSYHQYKVDETKYLNSEWVQIINPSSTAVSLKRWWVRDSSLLRYHFPASAVVPAGGRVTLRIGSGTNRPGDTYFWGLPKPPFNNPSNDRRAIHDGAYLFDTRGNMRASVLWGG